MLGLNAGFVDVFQEYETMRNWFDRGCKIYNFQVHTFEVCSVLGSHGNYSSASRSLNWLGPVSIVEILFFAIR